MKIREIAIELWSVQVMENDSGGSFVDTLSDIEDSDVHARKLLIRLEETVPRDGPPVHNKSHCKRIDHDIFQFRQGPYRVLWFYGKGRRIVVCTHFFRKDSRKTRAKHLNKARSRFKLYCSGTLEVIVSKNEEATR